MRAIYILHLPLLLNIPLFPLGLVLVFTRAQAAFAAFFNGRKTEGKDGRNVRFVVWRYWHRPRPVYTITQTRSAAFGSPHYGYCRSTVMILLYHNGKLREMRGEMKRRHGNRSPAFVAAGTAALKRFHATTRHLRHCGARRKRDGEPCQGIAMQNGRCYRHGGTTPRGERWHRTKWPDPKGSNPTRKLARKLRDANRAAEKRAKRLKAMTPEERAKHDRWQRLHKPGSAAERARLRLERAQAANIRKRMAAIDDRPAAPELAAVQAELADIERELAAIEATKGIGVFG